ncbi:MAG: hypothetical protein QXE66_02010 [Desulfurococcaceae archaeon]
MSSKPKFDKIVEALSYLVKDNVFGPVDRLARSTDLDMVRTALYEALRYLSTEIRKGTVPLVIDEAEIRSFLDEVERRGVGIARRVAIEALAKGLKTRLESTQTQQTQKPGAG